MQDIGLVRRISAICPDLPISVSTRMTMSSAETIDQIAALGVSPIVLAREFSLRETSLTASTGRQTMHSALVRRIDRPIRPNAPKSPDS